MEPFDLEQTRRLAELAAVPQHLRDNVWSENFRHAAINASLVSFNPQISNGPDSFPYFQLALPDPGPFTPFSIFHVMDHVLQVGAGVVIHSNARRDGQPLWVFTFGDILSYKMFGDFAGDPEKIAHPDGPPNPQDRNFLRASPNETYLPAEARVAIGRFMRGPFRVPTPKVGLVTGGALSPRQNLLVNLRPRDYQGDRNKLNAALRYLSWFVPKTYGLMALPDDWSDADMVGI